MCCDHQGLSAHEMNDADAEDAAMLHFPALRHQLGGELQERRNAKTLLHTLYEHLCVYGSVPSETCSLSQPGLHGCHAALCCDMSVLS